MVRLPVFRVQRGKAVSGMLGAHNSNNNRAILGETSRGCFTATLTVFRVKVTDTGVITSADGTQVNFVADQPGCRSD